MNENMHPADRAFDAAAPPRGCGRSEECVTYLYGESTPEESRVFRRHLESCDVCREELASLGGVRAAVGVWRDEALGTVPSLNIAEAIAPAAGFRQPETRERSAAAALRAFFSLSPLWLRAGGAAATLAVCALAALTLARAEVSWEAGALAFRTVGARKVVREQAPAPAVQQPVQAPARAVYTEQEVNELVERRVAEATARLNERRPEKVIDVAGERGRRQPTSAGTSAQRHRRAARPGTRRDETLLAEDDLPRLSDLLSGSY